jgi:transposase
MTSMTSPTGPVTVIGGVDTHSQTHHAAVIDQVGRQLGDRESPTTPAGYRALLTWLRGHSQLERVWVEGTGSYDAALARYLRSLGAGVVEVDRPTRKARRAKGKSDPLDAYAAARAALSGTATGTPKTRDGRVEAIRVLRVARSGAVKARTQGTNQLKALLLTAPAELREQLRRLSTTTLIATCARLRPSSELTDPQQATKTALRRLARRHQRLSEEIAEADTELRTLVTAAAPHLLALPSVGIEVAGQLLTSAGDNPDRLHSEAAFAHLCGVAPVPASSGRTHRHRLNRGGDRAANNALYIVVLGRLRYDSRTRVYADRRTKEGLSKPEIIRCLIALRGPRGVRRPHRFRSRGSGGNHPDHVNVGLTCPRRPAACTPTEPSSDRPANSTRPWPTAPQACARPVMSDAARSAEVRPTGSSSRSISTPSTYWSMPNTQLTAATEQLKSAVTRARQHRATWAAIARVLVTTRQAARQRFSRP